MVETGILMENVMLGVIGLAHGIENCETHHVGRRWTGTWDSISA